jgi:hypothetical protein
LGQIHPSGPQGLDTLKWIDMKFLLIALFALPVLAFEKYVDGIKVEDHEKVDHVELFSGKKDDVRFYKGKVHKEIELPIDKVLVAVNEFERRCNNEHRKRRKFTKASFDCTQKNSNLVESVKITDLKFTKSEPFKVDEYILARNIYNRGSYNHYDLITEKHIKQQDGKRVYVIKQRMLSDEEAKKYLGKTYTPQETVFLHTYGIFTLKEISKNKTDLTYEYVSHTDHWVLNKSISVSRFFDGTQKSLKNLVFQIENRANNLAKEMMAKKGTPQAKVQKL